MRILEGTEALDRLQAGVDKLANAVKVTIGPGGKNAIFRAADGKPIITNDGVTILQHYHLDDPVEDMAADIVRHVALQVNDEVGDGTTTATVLTQALLAECMKDLRPSLRGELQDGLDQAISALEASAVKMSASEVELVATIAVGGDQELGKVIADVVKRVGRGKVTVDKNEQLGVASEVTTGTTSGPVASQYFLRGKKLIDLRNVLVLVSKDEIHDMSALIPTMDKLAHRGVKELVVVAPRIGESVLMPMLRNLATEVFAAIPVHSDNPEAVAKATNATLLEAGSLHHLGNLTSEELGSATRVRIEKDTSLFVATRGNEKVGVIKLGTPTEVEYTERTLRIEDAINAVRAAQKDGVVEGAGKALGYASDEVRCEALSIAMFAPSEQIEANGGDIGPALDPLKVTIAALRAAVSAVSTLITTEVVIYEEEKDV